MNSVLSKNSFFVKEHVGIFKAANSYDISDLETQLPLMECREPNLGFFTKMFRFTKYKRNTAFHVEVNGTNGQAVLAIKRGISIFRSTVEILDEHGSLVGKFRQRMLTLGGKFDVLDTSDQVICTVEGKWSNFDYKFIQDGQQIAMLTKKWMGLGKELFTSADNYVINIEPNVKANDPIRIMILAAALCVDMVYGE